MWSKMSTRRAMVESEAIARQELKLIKWDTCKFEIVHFKQVNTGIKEITHEEIVAKHPEIFHKTLPGLPPKNMYNTPYNYKEACQRRDPCTDSPHRKTTR